MADRMGISPKGQREIERHVDLAEQYPAFKRPEWRQYNVLEAGRKEASQKWRCARMNQRTGNVLLTTALVTPLVLALMGCADKTVIVRSSNQMCLAHGGQYSHETKQCRFAAATTVSGQKACEDLAGAYMPEVQRCRFDE